MNGNHSKDAPLAWSQTGDPIELPDAAALWRVRRLSGKGGAPELVYDGDGLPLVVDVTIGAADFAEAVRQSGKYRLDALDEQRRALQGVAPAYVMVGGGVRAESATNAQGDVALKTLADVFVKQSAQVSSLIEACTKLVAAVDAAGVSKREPPPPAEVSRRNGADDDDLDDEDNDDDESDDEDSDAEGEDARPKEPTFFDKAMTFCATVPPENLRVLGEIGPDLLANGIEKVVSKGLGGIVANAVKPTTEGGAS